MARILKIERCDECKYANTVKLICAHSKTCGKEIQPYYHIPFWCPLMEDIPIRYQHNATCFDCLERL